MINLKYRNGLIAAFLYFFFLSIAFPSSAQYILNGAATQNSCNCYTITPQQFTQSGSVWNSNKINLNNSFDYNFNVFLGCQDANGADGIVFILQPISTSLGTTGGGMGFEGISPSIGVALDTWQNIENNDPVYDHVSIQANGVISHGGDLAGPVQATPATTNIEDCAWHDFRIKWNAATLTLEVYFDGTLRLSYTGNLVNTYFSGDPNVYWGFTAATGGANNLQQFCTALDPAFTTVPNDAVCFGAPITFTDNSISFAPIQSWFWDFGDATNSTQQNPSPHLYAAPGIYDVKLVIRGLDGCMSDTLHRTVTVGSKPIADFQIFDTCVGKPPRIIDQSANQVGSLNQWTWVVDGLVVSTDQQPVINTSTVGSHIIKLVVKSVIGCASDTITKTFVVKPAPIVDINAENGCVNVPVDFFGDQIDNITTITQWNWNFGDASTGNQQNPVHGFSSAGSFIVTLNAMASNGCVSINAVKEISVGAISVATIADTTILPNIPFLLNSSWSGTTSGSPNFIWSPGAGLSDPFTLKPEVSIDDDETYVITAISSEGCEARDTVNIKVFKGSAVYVPTGFTPNGDGRNDFLRGLYIGIKKVHYLRIYNRWGQLVFSTNSLTEGWDGTIKGNKQQTGTYVWMLKAEDLAGKIYEMKGTSTLIR